ncbi:MAG: hypothetical protein PHF00_04140 [Elusimicrobia bacterium]|nr:hypothetical protein [Elusimicrobiota bacterium]
MAAIARVSAVEFLSPEPPDPDCGSAEIRVDLEDGSHSTFRVMTPSSVGPAMNEAGRDCAFGAPALFVRSLRREDLVRAVGKMAAHMSGFWLRYYNSKKVPARKRGARK